MTDTVLSVISAISSHDYIFKTAIATCSATKLRYAYLGPHCHSDHDHFHQFTYIFIKALHHCTILHTVAARIKLTFVLRATIVQR